MDKIEIIRHFETEDPMFHNFTDFTSYKKFSATIHTRITRFFNINIPAGTDPGSMLTLIV